MPALAAAGYHVIAPNQRGQGNSSRPTEVAAYDIEHLSGDLVALLDHYGYDDATFVGHDWGASVVWGLTMLHPTRVNGVINLSLPYQERGEQPWLEFIEGILGGGDYYMSTSIGNQVSLTPCSKRTRPSSFATSTGRTSRPQSLSRAT
jgi:pimeloyl-ACP methyl ester carboxylesterase